MNTADNLPINHDEARQLACLKRSESNLARCYLDLDARHAAADLVASHPAEMMETEVQKSKTAPDHMGEKFQKPTHWAPLPLPPGGESAEARPTDDEKAPTSGSPVSAVATAMEVLPDAARDVLAERERQIEREGWTLEHDSDHDWGDLAAAAACYATGVPDAHTLQYSNGNEVWPWSPEEFKPKDQRRNLIRAGALILAEIERLDRAKALVSAQGTTR